MGKIRQKIKVGEFEVIILNYESQEKLVITVVDKNSKVVGKLRVSGDGECMEDGVSIKPFNLN